MPSNLLIFDAEYVSELTGRMNQACGLMAEAVASLKSASSHEKWKCKERTRILEDFEVLNTKLGRLDKGVNETTKVLRGSVSRFAALERQYETQAEGLSDELTSNHGYTAEVHTGGDEPVSDGQDTPAGNSEPSGEAGANAAGAGAGAGAAGAAGAGAAGVRAGAGAGAGAGTATGTGNEDSGEDSGTAGTAGTSAKAGTSGTAGANGAGVASAMAGRMAGSGSNNTSPDSGTQGQGGIMIGNIANINLPVTYIPDNPDAAARGTKDTRAAADAAVAITVTRITAALADGGTANAGELAEAYNAGRSIFESSAAIIDSPAQPHTAERLSMASGLVSLAGSNVSELGHLTGVSVAGSSSGVSFSSSAGSLLAAMEGNSDAGEFSNVLSVFAGTGSEEVSSSSSSGGRMSFFDMIIAALKKALSGEDSGESSTSLFASSSSAGASSSSSLSESSPVMEFLNKFVMDQG